FVLDQMQQKGFARPEIVAEAEAAPITVAPAPEGIPELAPEAVAEARRVLREVVGEAAAQGGYTVRTSIDPKLQEAARKALRDDIDAIATRRGAVAPFTRPKPPKSAKGKKAKAPTGPQPFEGDPKLEGFAVYLGEVVATDDAKNQVQVRVGTLRGTLDLAGAARA